jgi:hypothetical protein
MAKSSSPQISAKLGCGIIFGSMILLAWATEGNDGGGSATQPAPAVNHCDEGEAFVMSQSFVKDRLKAPSTADFPWAANSDGVRIVKTKDNPCTYVVTSYVDARNSFGAKLRTRYVATLHNVNNTDQWHLDDIQMDDQ